MLSRITKSPLNIFSKYCKNTLPLSSSIYNISNVYQKRWNTGGYTPADMPEIKNKWQAAAKVGEICESMKNIAAGALPGAERHLANSRPFGGVTLSFLQVDEEPEGINNVVHLLVGTERGMCGIVSSNTVRECDRYVASNKKQNHSVVVYGKRTAGVANSVFGSKLKNSYVELGVRVPTFEFCCHIAEYLLYELENWDKAILYYNEYENAIKFSLKKLTFFKSDIAQAIADLQFPNYEIEADEGLIIGCLVEWKLASEIYLSLAENSASEQSSRLQAMDVAVNNCNEMTKEYEAIYQGLRKASITNALILSSTCVKLALG